MASASRVGHYKITASRADHPGATVQLFASGGSEVAPPSGGPFFGRREAGYTIR